MSASPNPYRDITPWSTVKIGGLLVQSVLKAIDGNEIEDDWNVQRSTDSNKAIAAFRGTKLIEGVMLTFEAVDEESFDDLGDIWNLLAPPTNGKPPTMSIENAALAYIGLVKINRRKWKGPYPTDTGSWRVDLTVIQSSPPSPAKTGAQDPAKAGGGAAAAGVDSQVAALQAARDKLAAEAAGV